MKREITRKKLVELFGSVAKVAEFYGIDRQAVYLWPEQKLIPELREFQLNEALYFTSRAKRQKPLSLWRTWREPPV